MADTVGDFLGGPGGAVKFGDNPNAEGKREGQDQKYPE
jgi:hypothetical protein